MKHKILLLFLVGIIFPGISFSQSTNMNTSSYSPLHWAASQGYAEMIRVLVDKGYDINQQDANGFAPLHYAVASGSFPSVQFLIDRGADPYLVNNKNITPMSLAAQAGEQKIVDYLFVKMRSSKIDQLQAQGEKDRLNTDLVKAAKARAEAEKLRQQATEWTKEAEYWRVEAEKWTREANGLKEKQLQLDQLAKERYDQIMREKLSVESNYNSEKLARNAAERLLKEQNASVRAQIRAYEAQVAALAAQKATDAAIDNLAEEFLKRGISSQIYDTNRVMPIEVLNYTPIPDNNYSIELGETPILGGTTIMPERTQNNPRQTIVLSRETSSNEEVMAEEPVVEEVVAEEPAVEEVVAEEPAVEEVVAEEPAVEEVVAEEEYY